MKKLISMRPWLLLLLVPAIIFSCKDDDATPQELLPKLDGFYVYGTKTIAASAADPEAKMSRAALDIAKGAKVENMEGVYGKFLYIGANSTIKFAEVKNSEGTFYGALDGGTKIKGTDIGTTVPINDVVVHGSLVAGEKEIAIVTEGLYYAFVNINTKEFVIMPVKANIIGDATTGQWATSTALAQKSVSVDSAVFESTMALKGESGYRYRFNDGWQVYYDPNIVTMSSLGVKSYGTAWDTGINDIGYFTDNIPNKETGTFIVKLKYTASTGAWKETKLRSYANVKVGLFGNAYYLPSGAEGNWGDPYGLSLPTQTGNTYTWKWTDANLIEGREFVILENGTWGGMTVLYNAATPRDGAAFTDSKITNAAENFKVAKGGKYDITFTLNAVTGVRKLTIVAKS
jgi:hypothetical protein